MIFGRYVRLDINSQAASDNFIAEDLVLQPSNDQKVEFICACCGCCCGMLNMHKRLPKPVDFWASNFSATVNTELCIGCGNCMASCPEGALSLTKKGKLTVPPEEGESLYKAIAENKPGTLGKIKLMARLIMKK